MILAGIDIGTNSLRLLVAEIGDNTFRELHSERTITRLGQDLDRTGMLSRDAEERTFAALADFTAHIPLFSPFRTDAVGTSALRNAANAAEFIKEAKARCGLNITVITGEEEARLTLMGVGRALKGHSLESALVVDIGGGSTELILTRPGSACVAMSLPLGAVYLTERFIKHDPPPDEEVRKLRLAVRDELGHVDRLVPIPKGNRTCAGTAGTITTLAAMDQRLARYDPNKITNHVLTRSSIDAIVRTLVMSTAEERRGMVGLEAGRQDIILAGAIITQEILEWCGCEKMLVSDWGLREGIILDLYQRLCREHRA
jgi:exopolyphosphatase/guanosine-5'-triphosphate,3'-diphosphate pyrophosphatase